MAELDMQAAVSPTPTSCPPPRAQAYPQGVWPEAIHPDEGAITEQLVTRVECRDLPGSKQGLHSVGHKPVHRDVTQSRFQSLPQSLHQL